MHVRLSWHGVVKASEIDVFGGLPRRLSGARRALRAAEIATRRACRSGGPGRAGRTG
jgi:hypothetical protein